MGYIRLWKKRRGKNANILYTPNAGLGFNKSRLKFCPSTQTKI